MRRRIINNDQSYRMIEKDTNSSIVVQSSSSYNNREIRKSQQEVSTDTPRNLTYVLSSDGKDAEFGSGLNSGRKVSNLVQTMEGRDWLGTVWKLGRRDLQNVIKQYFSD